MKVTPFRIHLHAIYFVITNLPWVLMMAYYRVYNPMMNYYNKCLAEDREPRW